MPKLNLTDLATYKAYFADIAEKHVDIDGYKWGDKDVIRNDNRSEMPKRLLWATPYDGAKYGDQMSDNVVRTKIARIAYLIVPEGKAFSDEDAAFEACEAVIEQIIAKMNVDKVGKMVDGEWSMIVINTGVITTGPVEMKIGSSNYIGWEANIPFMDNANMQYDASKWS